MLSEKNLSTNSNPQCLGGQLISLSHPIVLAMPTSPHILHIYLSINVIYVCACTWMRIHTFKPTIKF